MLNSKEIIQIIDTEIQFLEKVLEDPEDVAREGYRWIAGQIRAYKRIKTEIEYQEGKLINEMAKSLSISEMMKAEEEKKYAYGKGILSNLKQDKDFVCPLCDGTHGNNAKCQI